MPNPNLNPCFYSHASFAVQSQACPGEGVDVALCYHTPATLQLAISTESERDAFFSIQANGSALMVSSSHACWVQTFVFQLLIRGGGGSCPFGVRRGGRVWGLFPLHLQMERPSRMALCNKIKSRSHTDSVTAKKVRDIHQLVMLLLAKDVRLCIKHDRSIHNILHHTKSFGTHHSFSNISTQMNMIN